MKTPAAPTLTDAKFSNHIDYGARSIKNHLANGSITQSDAHHITAFISDLQASSGISRSRSNKLITLLLSWRRWIPEYANCTHQDLMSGAAALRSARTLKGDPYSINSIIDHIQAIKQFFRWLVDNEYSTISVDKISRIRKPQKPRMIRTADDILSTDEITTIISHCISSRDRAILMLMYEGGLRGQDIGTLTWRQLKFDHYGSILNLDGKTGKPRYVRLIMSTEALATWQRDYPYPKTPESLVFVNHQGNPLTHQALTKQVRTIAKRAGIKKHLTLHLFRHSRITHLIREGVSIAIVGQLFWGDPRARELGTYLHLVNQDIDDAMLGLYGISSQDTTTKTDSVSPRQCSHCKTISGPDTDCCPRCGIALTEEARKYQQAHIGTIDEEAIEALVEKAVAKKLADRNI